MLTLSQYIKKTGVKEVSAKVGVRVQNVQQWASLVTAPRPRHAHALIKCARGKLTLESIYAPFIRHKVKTAAWK